MKIKLTLIVVLFTQILCAQNNNSSNNTTISESNWNSKTLLSELFEGEKVESLNAIKWKPYNGEFVQTSFDGYCYTTIDSIYSFKTDESNYRIVVMKTISFFDKDMIEPSIADGSTVGIALFKEEDNNWNLLNFNRSILLNGGAGYLGKIQIIDLGKNSMLLSLDEIEHQEVDLHQYLISLNPSNFGMIVFSTKLFHRIVDDNETEYKFEFSEIEIKKAETEEEPTVMKLTKKCTTIKEEIETTTVLSTVLLEFDGYGFY
jgi:hypothetical protein